MNNTGGFVAGTLVHTDKGLVPIEQIKVGDWVLTYPDDQPRPTHKRQEHEYIYRMVTKTFVTDDQPLSKLIIAHLGSGKRETIFVTANHPIYCKNSVWIAASDMKATDAVENYYFGNLMIARNYSSVESGRAFNFEVDEFHTYYVGELGVWVHDA